MSEEAKRYNGWTNYETWCVHLWLTNEEGSYRYWREEARRHRKEAPTCPYVEEGTWTVEVAERVQLAAQIKSEVEDASPIEGASLFSDLLSAALSEVDWHEIAGAFLEEVEPEDEPEKTDQAESNEEEGNPALEFLAIKRERAFSKRGPLFELGRVVSTPGALAELNREDIDQALSRHHRGDWGEVDQHDWRENEMSLKEGFRLLSVYRSPSGVTFWVITEADRSSTCVLLPSEY